jgi:hypothetical protein
MASGEVRNEYQLRVMNKTQASAHYELRLAAPAFIRLSSVTQFQIAAGEIENLPMQLLTSQMTSANVAVEIELCDLQTNACVAEETRFLGPTLRSKP